MRESIGLIAIDAVSRDDDVVWVTNGCDFERSIPLRNKSHGNAATLRGEQLLGAHTDRDGVDGLLKHYVIPYAVSSLRDIRGH
jgi:hypothetical protein